MKLAGETVYDNSKSHIGVCRNFWKSACERDEMVEYELCG